MKNKFFPAQVATVAAVLLCMAPAKPAHAAPRPAKAPASKNDAAEALILADPNRPGHVRNQPENRAS